MISVDFVIGSLRKACDMFSYFETAAPARAGPSSWGGAAGLSGSSMVNTVPSGPLEAEMVPLWAVTISFAMASPRPAPPVEEERAESRR